jgi:RNA polymerase sigma-70 factor (ECF subfamily)
VTFARPVETAVGAVSEHDPLPPEDRLPPRERRTLNELYSSQRGRLRRFFKRRVGSNEADDLVHEAFARYAARTDQSPDPVAEPEAYLQTVATNLLRNRAKLAVRRAASHHHAFEEDCVPGADPTSLLEQRDALRRVDAAISRLRPRTREVFMLKRVEELTYLQIAERMGMSVKGVKKQMAKALYELRRDVGAL